MKIFYQKNETIIFYMLLFFIVGYAIYNHNDAQFDGLMLALRDCMIAALAFLSYNVSKEISMGSGNIAPKLYIAAVGVSFLIGAFSWSALGIYTEDGDPLFGGGSELVIDFIPTHDQRDVTGAYWFFLFFIPAFFGIKKGVEERVL